MIAVASRTVPFCSNVAFVRAGFEKPFVGCQGESCNGSIRLRKISKFRISSESSDKDDLIEAVDVSHLL